MSLLSTVARSALPAALAPLFIRAGLAPSALPLTGPEFGRSFRLRASGPPSAAATLVRRFLDARRSESGWLDVSVSAPSGAPIRIFIDADRSLATRKVSWHTARAARAFNEAAPNVAVDASKSSGIVSKDWIDLLSVTFDRVRRDVVLEWHESAIRATGADPAAIRQAYAAAIARPSSSSAPGAPPAGDPAPTQQRG